MAAQALSTIALGQDISVCFHTFPFSQNSHGNKNKSLAVWVHFFFSSQGRRMNENGKNSPTCSGAVQGHVGIGMPSCGRRARPGHWKWSCCAVQRCSELPAVPGRSVSQQRLEEGECKRAHMVLSGDACWLAI